MKVLSKPFYITAGIVFTIIGGLSIWQTVNVINTPVKSVDLESLRANTINSCINLARNEGKYGFQTETDTRNNKKQISIKTTDISSWDSKMYAASEMLSQCQGMKMVSFCFGGECDIDDDDRNKEPGMKMVLEYDKDSEVVVAR